MTFASLVGERLKEARDALGLNQAEMAKAMGVTREYWGRCERGVSVPGGEVLAALALKGLDVGYILTGNRTQSVAESNFSKEEEALVDNYRHADGEGRSAARRILSALSSDTKKAA